MKLRKSQRGFIINPYRFAAEPVSGDPNPIDQDPFYPDVTVLLHFNGSNGATTFVDQIGNAWTANGNAQLTTTTAKYGSAALILDGSADWLSATIPDVIGTADFTIEAWIRIDSLASDGEIFCISAADLNLNSFNIVFEYKTTGALRGSIQTGSGGAVNVDITSASGLLATGAYYHVALTANGTAANIWINGSSVGSGTITGTRANGQSACRIGYLTDALSGAVTRYFNGRVDDFRITKACRYTATFTPPAAQMSSYSALTYTSSPITATSISNDAQGVATDGTHVWFSSSTAIRKYTKAGTLVTSRDVSADNPTDKQQINGMYIQNGVLYVSAAKFVAGVGTSYIVEYDPDTLAYITHHSLAGVDGFSEGLAFHDGYWWVVYHATKVVAKYSIGWSLVATYSLSFSVTGSSGGYGAGTGYDGIAWSGDYLLCNIHSIYEQDYMDVYYWNGATFLEIGRLKPPTSKAQQGLCTDPTESGVLWFAERNASGTDSVAKCLLS